MLDAHHIISDGISHQILVREFIALYKNEVLSPLRIHYKDFSGWQNSSKEKERIKQQEAYWLRQFPAEIPVLQLPVDHPFTVGNCPDNPISILIHPVSACSYIQPIISSKNPPCLPPKLQRIAKIKLDELPPLPILAGGAIMEIMGSFERSIPRY